MLKEIVLQFIQHIIFIILNVIYVFKLIDDRNIFIISIDIFKNVQIYLHFL